MDKARENCNAQALLTSTPALFLSIFSLCEFRSLDRSLCYLVLSMLEFSKDRKQTLLWMIRVPVPEKRNLSAFLLLLHFSSFFYMGVFCLLSSIRLFLIWFPSIFSTWCIKAKLTIHYTLYREWRVGDIQFVLLLHDNYMFSCASINLGNTAGKEILNATIYSLACSLSDHQQQFILIIFVVVNGDGETANSNMELKFCWNLRTESRCRSGVVPLWVNLLCTEWCMTLTESGPNSYPHSFLKHITTMHCCVVLSNLSSSRPLPSIHNLSAPFLCLCFLIYQCLFFLHGLSEACDILFEVWWSTTSSIKASWLVFHTMLRLLLWYLYTISQELVWCKISEFPITAP